jgi:protein TonB
LKRKDPEYPRLARNSGAGGLVELVATIQVDGRVGEVKVLRGHPLLRQAAVDAVKSWIYKPAVLNGTPIETQTQVNLNFQGGR